MAEAMATPYTEMVSGAEGVLFLIKDYDTSFNSVRIQGLPELEPRNED